MILVDFNQVMIATISMGTKTFGSELNPDMIRHMFLSSIVGYKKKFGAKYGEIIVCCDGPGSWRKEFFPYYKAKRAQGRADSPLDWEMIFATLTSMYTEIDEFFPYKIVRVDRADAIDAGAKTAAAAGPDGRPRRAPARRSVPCPREAPHRGAA